MKHKETKERSQFRILSRAGKATSHRYNKAYNVKNLDNQNYTWIDLNDYEDIENIPGEEYEELEEISEEWEQ